MKLSGLWEKEDLENVALQGMAGLWRRAGFMHSNDMPWAKPDCEAQDCPQWYPLPEAPFWGWPM